MSEPVAPVQTPNPYVGPRTFLTEEGDRFYGREAEARDLLSLVLAERLVLFYAQSGAGKSSLINTRLRPGLAKAGYTLLPTGRVGGDLPAGLTTVDNIFVFNLLLTLDQNRHSPAALATTTLLDYLTEAGVLTLLAAEDETGDAEVTPTAPPSPAPLPPVALIIDQFEEILTTQLDMWPKREEFFHQVRTAMNQAPNLWVVLVLREDFVAGLDPYARLLPGRLRTRFYMQRMELAAAQATIARPVAASDHPFAPGVAAQLAHNLSLIRVPGQASPQPGQYVEPVHLQVVCYQLWENLRNRPPGPITAADLHEAGDVDQALQRFYQATLARVLAQWASQQSAVSSQQSGVSSRQSLVSERQLHRWFNEQLITPTGTRGLVHQGATHTGGLPNALVQQLPGVLVRTESCAGAAWIELTHDRLVEPILAANRAWATANPNPLTAATQAWLAAGRVPEKLLRGERLAEAQRYAAQNAHDLTADEQALLAASVRQQTEERAAARQAALLRRNLLITGVLLLALLGGLAWWGWSKSIQAQRNADLAQQQVTRLEGERLLKEVRNRKERILSAAIGTSPAPTTFVSPLASPLTVTVLAATAIAASEPFTGPAAIVNEVAIIRQLLT